MSLTIKRWQSIFRIDPIAIVDHKGWNPYALNEGLADENTMVFLSVVEIAKLSPLSADRINKIIACSKV